MCFPYCRHKRPLRPPTAENIYENVPPRHKGGREPAPLPPIPHPKKAATHLNGFPPVPPPKANAPLANNLTNNLMSNDQRLRGVSVDRYREYKTPQYYEDTYYTREDSDHRVTVKHVDYPPPNGRLERHASHPNLRPRPATAGGRRLPKTPNQPPGTIIVIENVVSGTGRGRTLPDVKRAGSSAALDRAPRLRGGHTSTSVGVENERRSYSLPRRPPTAKAKEIPQGTGRRLPPTPHQAALPLHHSGPAGPGSVSGNRKRELPKPQSLELRHSNREFMNTSNASLGLGGLLGRSSRSMNFPRLEGSPTHSECSSESGFLLSGRTRRPVNMLRSNSVSRRKLPDF